MHQEFNWKSQNPITHTLCEESFIVLRDVWLWITLSILILNFSLLFLAPLGFNISPDRLPCFCIKHFPYCLLAVRYNKLVSLDLARTVQKNPYYTNMHLLWASITGCSFSSLARLKPTLTKTLSQRWQWNTKNKDSESGLVWGTQTSLISSQQKTKIFHSCREHTKHVSRKANFGLIQKCFHIIYST